MRTIRGTISAWLVAACCLGAWSARAVGPEVRDNAGLFSAAVIKQADETIHTIQKDFRKELLIETFPAVPESRKEEYARNREEFFANFVRERAQAARVDGIYVLMMKEAPPHRLRIQVGVGQVTRQRAFLPSDRDELVRLFQSSFRENKYDEGLRTGVTFVDRTLRKNLQAPSGTPIQTTSSGAPARQTPSTVPASPKFGGSPLLMGILIVGGVMLLMFLMRLIRGATGNAGGGLRGAGGMGGGGLFSGLLGGLGGALAGNWLYDQFSGRHSQSGDVHASNAPDSLRSDVGGDYSSSGGDLGGGGFDSGGGDIGGGDFGGGGDV